MEISEKLKPSKRGELEITDVIKSYLHDETLNVFKLPRGTAWLDAGTSSSLFDSSAYVQAIEKRQGVKIGCPEEATYNQGNINKTQLRKLIKTLPTCEYKEYLLNLLKYASLNFKLFLSFQNFKGIVGNAFLQTNSPFLFLIDLP